MESPKNTPDTTQAELWVPKRSRGDPSPLAHPTPRGWRVSPGKALSGDGLSEPLGHQGWGGSSPLFLLLTLHQPGMNVPEDTRSSNRTRSPFGAH